MTKVNESKVREDDIISFIIPIPTKLKKEKAFFDRSTDVNGRRQSGSRPACITDPPYASWIVIIITKDPASIPVWDPY